MSTQDPLTKNDAANWAKLTPVLKLTDVPADAINLNVSGRRQVGPIQGFGKMWQKTYRVVLEDEAITPAEVISEWKSNFPSFWPKGNRFYGPLTGIAPGDVALLNLTMPGRLKLSTGVLVLYADDESFTFMTPQGHMFAAFITFSAYTSNGRTVAQAQVLLRANDPVFELALAAGGHSAEDRFWEYTLASLARHLGVDDPTVETTVVCVDRRRQWRNARNLWHNSAIRSSIYMMNTPFRLAVKPFRKQPVPTGAPTSPR
jgi:hypothetical protein